MKEFVAFLWMRFVLRCRNVGYRKCRWNPACGPKRILIDEGMCHDCYFNDYVLNYK